MDKVFKAINKNIRFFNLACHKLGTDFALKVVSRKPKHKNINIKTNISYGKHKLQKYDIIYPANNTSALPVIFYLHGGAWCSGDKYGYNKFCANLSDQGYICVNINYRFLPNVSLKVVMLDCIRAIKHFAENNFVTDDNKTILADLTKCFIVGDSAGAHLASLIAGKLTSNKLKLNINILALGLYYGVYDFNNLQIDPSPILTEFNQFFISTTKNLKSFYKAISPTTYVTKNFPPCFLTVGKIDKLYYQTAIFKNLLDLYNIKTDYLCFDKTRKDGRHAFLNLPMLNSSKQAFERLSNFFKTQLGAYDKEK